MVLIECIKSWKFFWPLDLVWGDITHWWPHNFGKFGIIALSLCTSIRVPRGGSPYLISKGGIKGLEILWIGRSLLFVMSFWWANFLFFFFSWCVPQYFYHFCFHVIKPTMIAFSLIVFVVVIKWDWDIDFIEFVERVYILERKK